MIATAFFDRDIDRILDAGVAALDTRSRLREIVADVRRWHAEYPHDWRATRARLKRKYSQADGGMRDRNGYELNTGATIAALLYGGGDLPQTLMTAFNFGWDADNTAATAGTIVGVIKGYRWIMSQGWVIVDRYRNTTRDEMPVDETITSFADRLADLASVVIVQQGGMETRSAGGQPRYRIRQQQPDCVYPLEDPGQARDRLRSELRDEIDGSILRSSTDIARARAAYLAICLDMAARFQREHPAEWAAAIQTLSGFENVTQALFHHADVPAGEPLRRRATVAGLKPPARRRKLW